MNVLVTRVDLGLERPDLELSSARTGGMSQSL